jgi:RNA polymerase sigma factor (sigma-70 family)
MGEHGTRLLRQARFHSERDQDAEDALGDACVQFLLHFEGGDVEEARRWMLVVVKRCSWAIARRRRERRAVVEEVPAQLIEADLGVEPAEERRGPGQLIEAAEEVAGFVAALGMLKPDERRALVLLALGYSFEEIATIEGWTYSKVKRSTYEGRLRLRGMFVEGGEES